MLSERSYALLDAASGAMDVRVPSCPDWRVADLVTHVGLVWGWAADIVTTKARADMAASPDDRSDDALRGWAKGRAVLLLDALGASDPEADCWTFGLPRSVRFWFRRTALEATMHAWDAEAAVGTASHIDPEVAADGVDEYLHVMVARSLRVNPDRWTGETVHLHRTDGDGEWVVRLGPDGDVAIERAHSKSDLALRGSAEALWLWCANRATADEVGIEQFGDEGIAARWQRGIAF